MSMARAGDPSGAAATIRSTSSRARGSLGESCCCGELFGFWTTALPAAAGGRAVHAALVAAAGAARLSLNSIQARRAPCAGGIDPPLPDGGGPYLRGRARPELTLSGSSTAPAPRIGGCLGTRASLGRLPTIKP